MRKFQIRFLAAGLLPVMLGGCGAANALYGQLAGLLPAVKPGETISSDSKWINSDLDGAVDETVSVREQDDFHTAVNRDWILETQLSGEDFDTAGTFITTTEVLAEQNKSLLQPSNTAVDPELMSQEEYGHLESLACSMAQLAGDWQARNARGAEPVRQYVEAVWNVSSLDELTAYLLDPQSSAESAQELVSFAADTDTKNREQYAVLIAPCASWSLSTQGSYGNITGTDLQLKKYNEQAADYVLGALGFSEEEIRRILRDCYRLEGRLAVNVCSQSEQQQEDYLEQETDSSLKLEDIQTLQGGYPLTEILAAYGLDRSSLFTLYEPGYLKAVGRIYCARNLEELKAYYIMQTVLKALPYLDRTCYDLSAARNAALTDQTAEGENDGEDQPTDPIPEEEPKDGKDTAKTATDDEMVQNIVESLLPEVLDEIYVARYCTADEKRELTEMTEDMIRYYRQMLLGEEWLTEATRQEAVRKLDAIQPRILYPDEMTDYSGLELDPDGTLLDAVNATERFGLEQYQKLVNQPIDRGRWLMSTRIVNAVYIPTDNTVNIFAGIMADGYLYGAELSKEEKLGRIGMVIGHEITHAFDTYGYQYDQDGLRNSWWTPEDEEAFRARAAKVAKFYSAITPIAGVNYSGENVQSEAIADMGGLKCALALAKEDPDFDYQEFFRAFAGVWKCKNTYTAELAALGSDEHPLGFLRTNVTVQQFDEFLGAFDIQKGDGMYLDPAKRITVW